MDVELTRETQMDNVLSEGYVADTYALALQHRGLGPLALALPPRENYRVIKPSSRRSPSVEVLEGPPVKRSRPEDSDSEDVDKPQSKGKGKEREVHDTTTEDDRPPPSRSQSLFPGMSKPDVTLYPEDIRLRDIPRMCVERPSPLECPNQDIVRPHYQLE